MLRLYESALKCLKHNLSYRVGTRLGQNGHVGLFEYLNYSGRILHLIRSYIYVHHQNFTLYLFLYCDRNRNAFPDRTGSARFAIVLAHLPRLTKLDQEADINKKAVERLF